MVVSVLFDKLCTDVLDELPLFFRVFDDSDDDDDDDEH